MIKMKTKFRTPRKILSVFLCILMVAGFMPYYAIKNESAAINPDAQVQDETSTSVRFYSATDEHYRSYNGRGDMNEVMKVGWDVERGCRTKRSLKEVKNQPGSPKKVARLPLS